ncbi:MAG: von Willebrand factor type A domain-containing protein [Sphingobacteriia bacterium]|jgi:Ca-activated chloride channel family protein
MRVFIWLIILVSTHTSIYSQYYLRGEIKNELGQKLEGVKINLKSKGTIPYFSGNTGTFGISSNSIEDSIVCSFNGYEIFSAFIDSRKFQSIVLKMLPSTAQLYNKKLVSSITDLTAKEQLNNSVLGESYTNIIENNFVNTKQYPETGFALNIDKAAYSNIRRFLTNEMFIPADAIRVEEMLNYFNFTPAYKKNESNESFTCNTQITTCPWNTNHQLLFVNIVAPKINLDSIPPSNLVFLIDVSGSMDKPNRLPLLQSSFKFLINNLREKDTLSIVTYGGNVAIALAATSGGEKQKMINAIDSLSAFGDTPGEDAIRVAYSIAKSKFIPKGNNRVILATDGDFNVGQTSEKELEDLISSYRQTGIYLTCLGVGMGNYKDSKLESLSKKGNGNFAYIDQIREAEKIMVKEFTQTMFAVANDAFVKIKFNKKLVNQYRLIGYDNKRNSITDTSSQLEGGEVGSGHSSMAIFEIAKTNDSLLQKESIGSVAIQYKKPDDTNVWQQNFNVMNNISPIDSADATYRFAASVAAFGSLLKKSKHLGNFSFTDVYQLAASSITDEDQTKKEMLLLIQKAIKVYQPDKRKSN